MRKIDTKIGTMFYDWEQKDFYNYYDSDKRWLGCVETRPYKEMSKIEHIADLANVGLFEFVSFAKSENELLEVVNDFCIENEDEPFASVEELKDADWCGVYGRIGHNYFFANWQ